MEKETITPLRGADGPKQVAREIVRKMPGKFWAATEAGYLLMLDESTSELSLTTNLTLQAVIEAHFDTPRLVRAEGGAKFERAPLILGRQFLVDVIAQLMLYAAPAPQWAAPTRQLNYQRQQEVRYRRSTGESRQQVARAYSITEAQVDALVARQ
jgi:hypothetical protein